jgi:DNA-binding transcriptional LysR family regulator
MDLRLLSVFDEIYKTRNVSRAAENLDLAQTSVSLALGRMRKIFNDPLFVRTAGGMLPTPHATELREPLRQALELINAATRLHVVFEPTKSDRSFRISMTDISHFYLLPALMNRLGKAAPLLNIEVLRISADTHRELESGDSDLAIGYMPELDAGFYQQKLFDDTFACVVRKGHPRIDTRITRAVYSHENHVDVTAIGTGHDLVARELHRLGIARTVRVSIPTLPGLGNLIASTDLVATVPRRVAQTLERIAHVKGLTPPFPSPTFAIKQHWHERYHHDPANRWLRSIVSDLFHE